MNGTFSVWYIGVFGEPQLWQSGFTRRQLREAWATWRFCAHTCTWRTTWLLKREHRTIARLPSSGRPS